MWKLDAAERCSSRSDRLSRNRILSEVSVPLENQNTVVAEENITALARIKTIYFTEISCFRHNVDNDLVVMG
jgi:flagellar basal body rod protein FlgB